jgi:hypothetical protein
MKQKKVTSYRSFFDEHMVSKNKKTSKKSRIHESCLKMEKDFYLNRDFSD